MSLERITSYSPLRISFSGGGTDISPFLETYGSALVNATIDRGVTVKYRSDSRPIEVSSRDFLSSSVPGSSRLRKGLSHLIVRFLEQRGVDTGRVIINSDVPPGSGLGSSSALITAVIAMVETLEGNEIIPDEIAESAFKWEKDFFGITLGKQDPYAIAFGGFKYMEINGGSKNVLRFDDSEDFLKTIENNSLLIYTGKTRESSKVLQDQVTKSTEGDSDTLARLKKLKNLAVEMKKTIIKQDISEFASLINEGWQVKKNISANVSNPRVDSIIERAMSHGGLAARLLGGGSEGFIYVLSRDGYVADLQKDMLRVSKFTIRFSFDSLGTRIIYKQ